MVGAGIDTNKCKKAVFFLEELRDQEIEAEAHRVANKAISVSV